MGNGAFKIPMQSPVGRVYRPDRRARVACVALCVMLVTCSASGADVGLQLSTRDAFVGIPLTLQVNIQCKADPAAPMLPPIPTADVQPMGDPGRNQFTQIINGRMSQTTTVTYSYQLTPTQAGQLRIPPISVEVDGQTLQTEPVVIRVSPPPDTGDHLFVEIKADRESCFVGERLTAVLEIWVLPFTDRRNDYSFNQNDMWSCIEPRQSKWGVFASVLDQRNAVSVRRERRRNTKGVEQNYFVYQIEAEFWPEKPGALDLGDIRVVVNYPRRLGRNDSMFLFERGLRVVESIPLVGTAQVAPMRVKPIPTEGRPAYFRGAIGPHRIRATARPIEAAVGDPITLTLEIEGGGRLDLLRPPPLDQLPQLARSFKIPNDPLAGTVDGNVKRFVQSIRAVSDEVTEIPSIPFAYFDPAAEKFVTVRTDPIPIRIKPVEKLALSRVVESGGAARRPTELTESAAGIVGNDTDLTGLLAQETVAIGWPTAAGLLAPPFAYAACAWMQRRRLRLRHDSAFARRSGAARRAREALAAVGVNGTDAAAARAAVLRTYVADRFNLPGGLTVDELLRALIDRGVPDEITRRIGGVLEQGETLRYAGTAKAAGATSKGAATTTADADVRACIEWLERERVV